MEEEKEKFKPPDPIAAGKAITYYKNYRKICGSVNATILFQQIEFYFFVMRKKGKFYKFLSPPEKEAFGYQYGDSWTETLDFSESEFRNAYKHIGTVYQSYTAYKKSSDKFQGKMFASYYNRRSGKTFYFRNNELITKKLLVLREEVMKSDAQNIKQANSVNKESSSLEIGKVNLEYTERTPENLPEIVLCCNSKKLRFLWKDKNTKESYEYLEGEEPLNNIIIFAQKHWFVKNEITILMDINQNSEIKITKTKFEAIVTQIIKSFFSEINASYQTLITNKSQRKAIMSMLTNKRIGYSGIVVSVDEISSIQDSYEHGLPLEGELILEIDTPVKLMYNYTRVRRDYKQIIKSPVYEMWKNGVLI